MNFQSQMTIDSYPSSTNSNILSVLKAQARANLVIRGAVTHREFRRELTIETIPFMQQNGTACVVMVVEREVVQQFPTNLATNQNLRSPGSDSILGAESNQRFPAEAVTLVESNSRENRLQHQQDERRKHYNRILPPAERQQELMNELARRREAARTNPVRSSLLRVEDQKIRIYDEFAAYITKAAKSQADRARVPNEKRQDLLAELLALAKERFFTCVDRWEPRCELSRLYSRTLKFAFKDHLRAKVAEYNDSAAVTLHTPGKRFREIIAFSAASKAGEAALAELCSVKRWSPKKQAALVQAQGLLGSVVRLDKPLDFDDSGSEHCDESFSDETAESPEHGCYRDDLRAQLAEAASSGLTPYERLVLSHKFDCALISPKEIRQAVKHAKTSEPVEASWLERISTDKPSVQTFVSSLGVSPEFVRQVAIRALKAMSGMLSKAGLDRAMCSETITAGTWA